MPRCLSKLGFVKLLQQNLTTSTGLDHMMLMQQYTGVPYEKILASWHRLFEHVVPRFGTQSIAQKRELTDA